MAGKDGYILAGNLHIGTTDIKNESDVIVSELAKIEQAAKGAQKALDKATTGSSKTTTSSGSKGKETAETKALVIAMQKYRQELQYLDRDLKAGKITSEQYGMYLGNLKDTLRRDTSVDSFLKVADNETRKLTASEKELLAIFGRVESKMAGVEGAQKRLNDSKTKTVVVLSAEEKAMADLAIDTQKNKINLDSLTLSYKSGKMEVTEYLAELKKMKSAMSGTASGITAKGSTSALTTPEKGFLTQWNNVNKAVNGVNKQMASLGKTSNEVNLSTRKTIQTLLGWDVARQGIFYIVQYLQSTLNTLKDINTYIINIQKVTDQTDAEMQAVQSSASSIASTFGRLTTDYLEALEAFSRLKDLDAEKFAGMSLLLQNVGDVTAEVSQETLIATNNGFKLNGSYTELMKTIDAMNEISNNNATTITKMSEAIKVSASTATAAGISFNQYIALIGTASAVTQREGSQIGNAMRTMFLTIEQVTSASDDVDSDKFGKAAKAIESLGVEMRDLETGQLRDVYSILQDVSKVWEGDQITKNQKMMFAQAVGNKRQADIILGIMNNWTMVEKQLEEATNSTGSALKENETYMKSWEAHLNTLVSTVTDKMQQFLNSGDVLGIVDTGTKLVNIIGEIAPALVALGVAYQVLNKQSGLHKLRDSLGTGFGIKDFKSNIFTQYTANINNMSSAYGALDKKLVPVSGKIKAMSSAVYSSISPMSAAVVGLTIAISVYAIAMSELSRISQETTKETADAVESIKTKTSNYSNSIISFSKSLENYIELYNRYNSEVGAFGGLTSEEFSKMIESGNGLTETLDSVGMSFNDIYKYGNSANGAIDNVADSIEKITKSYKEASAVSIMSDINKMAGNLSGSLSEGVKLSSLPVDTLIDIPNLYKSSGADIAFKQIAKDMFNSFSIDTSVFEDILDAPFSEMGAEIGNASKKYLTNQIVWGDVMALDSGTLSETIANIDSYSQQMLEAYKKLIPTDVDQANVFLSVTTNLNTMSDEIKTYLSENVGLVEQIDFLRGYLGESIMTSQLSEMYDALKMYAVATDGATQSTKEFVSAATGNNITQDDASSAFNKSQIAGITEEDKAEAEAIMQKYIETVDEYDKKMESISDTQYTLGNFDKADNELVKLKNDILGLIQTYQDFNSSGNETGKESVMDSLSTYGIEDIEGAVDAYTKLANATRDLSGYTKDLTQEQEDEVSSLLDLVNAATQSSTNAQELAAKYVEVANSADGSELSQIELRQAYLAVAEAMGLSTDATFANQFAIAQLALANGSLTSADQQRIISQASVSESAKSATLVILRSQKAQIEQQIATATTGVSSGQTMSQAWYQTANNVKNASNSMQSNFLSLQNVMSGQSKSVMTNSPSLSNVGSGSLQGLQRQLQTVNQLIGMVQGLTTVASKSEIAAGKAGGSAAKTAADVAKDAADAAQKAIDEAVTAFDDGMIKIEDSITTAFETGAISAKEALARTVIELNAIKPTYDAIKQKAKSTWTDIEKSTAEHYENLLDMSKDYSDQVQSDFDDAVSTVEDLQGAVADALGEKYDEQHDKRVKQLEEQRDAEIAVYDAQIESLQKQIDALNDQKEEKTSNLIYLQSKYEASKLDDSVIGKKRTAELEKEIIDLTKELAIDKLEKEKSEAEESKDIVDDKYKAILDADSDYYDETLKRLDSANTEAARYAEANKLIMSNNHQAILDLLVNFAPQYGGVGQLLGQTLADTMSASVTASLSAVDVVMAGTAAVASTYQSQAQAFLTYANAQMASLEARLSAAVTTANSINTVSGGGGGGQISYTPPTSTSTSTNAPAPVTFGTIGNSLVNIGNNPAKTYTIGKNETTGKYFVKNNLTSKIEWFFRDDLYKKITGQNPVGKLPEVKDTIIRSWMTHPRSTFGQYVPAFSKGGISDQTQLALLHGTKQNPERILPANVTKTFDDFVYKFLPRFSNVFSGLNGKTSNTSNATNVHNEITMNNSVPSDWSEKNTLDNVERMITGAMRKAGINP